MWVIYRKSDLRIMGMSAHTEHELDKDFALKEVVRGLVNGGKPDEYDAIQIKDESKILPIMSAPPNKQVLKRDKKGTLVPATEEARSSMLVLRSDAPDVHPVDGIPEIPADGNSFTSITIQKIDADGQPLEGKEDADLLYLRTNYGALMSDDGKKEVNSIKLVKGQAVFRLASEKAKRVATVEVFNADQSVQNASVRIEFI